LEGAQISENIIQASFSSGELAPSIFARTDLAAYHTGLAVCRNFFVDYRSGISTRSGTKFVIQCLKSSTAVRLIGFSQSVTTTYVIEFGDRYCRFISNGAPVLESPFGITSITQGAPATANIPGNNFVSGDWIFITGVVGMLAINGRFAQVGSAIGAVVTLLDVNGNPINSTNFSAYSGGGTASRVYTIVSPYAAADLALIKFVQSVSVLFITHPLYPPKTLSFLAPTNWAFASIVFGTTIDAPTGLVGVASSAGTANYSYEVTAVDASGQESLPSAAAAVNGAVNIGTTAGTISLTWNSVASAVTYNLYKAELSVAGAVPSGVSYGFIGFSSGTSFVDSNIVPDFTTTPEVVNNLPFANGNNPGSVVFFQQRAYYASSTSQPATFWGSQPGQFNNFNFSTPIQASDEITGTIVSTQLNSIRYMLPMPGGLVFGTGRAAFTLSAGSGTNATIGVTPANATITPQAYNGSSDVPPIVVNEDILYVQAKGSIVRDLSYNIYVAIYTGTDISIKSNHLFFGHGIREWTYAEEPFKVVWSVRDDGILLSLTFMKEQQMIGWARHDTLGLYQSVTSVQEGQVDAAYFVVTRFVGGNTVQWIERQQQRIFTYGAEDAWSVDCGTQSSLPTPAANLVVSSSVGNATFTASVGVFSSSSVGQVLRAGGGIATITGFSSSTQITGTITQPITQVIPNDPNRTPVPFASGSWSLATPATKFFGFDYLIGQRISILADGGVSPSQVVAGDGSITLPSPATKVVGGFGYQCQAQTMPLDVGEPTVIGKRKKIGAVNLILANTRGLKVGRNFNSVIGLKDQNIGVQLNQAIPLQTANVHFVIDPLWDVPGQICFQIDDPLPATILGVVPEIVIGDSVK